ncbi:MAG: DUF1501 domain-containing protein [Verrucomicrobiota bacterium]|nr:DUF1501 domain-containing protein [Verrucomicrobiota bacterium]
MFQPLGHFVGVAGWPCLGSWATEDRLHLHDLPATVLHLHGIHNFDLIYRYKGRPATSTINKGAAYTKITSG